RTPPPVGGAPPALLGGANQRTGRLLGPVPGYPAESRLRDMVALFLGRLEVEPLERLGGLLTKQVGRLGHPVVAQVHDDELGRKRLAGIPGRALRLAAPTFGAGGEVEHAFPGEVLDLAAAEYRLIWRIVEIDWLDVELNRQRRVHPGGQHP